MADVMEYSPAGFALTKAFEGLRLEAYADAVGVWTLGYGHTGPDVYRGRKVTEFQADAILRCDVGLAVAYVNRVKPANCTQGQFDALVDFAFNLGCKALLGSTLLRLFLAGNVQAAADEFVKWDHAGGHELEGLKKRRLAERAMFLGQA